MKFHWKSKNWLALLIIGISFWFEFNYFPAIFEIVNQIHAPWQAFGFDWKLSYFAGEVFDAAFHVCIALASLLLTDLQKLDSVWFVLLTVGCCLLAHMAAVLAGAALLLAVPIGFLALLISAFFH